MSGNYRWAATMIILLMAISGEPSSSQAAGIWAKVSGKVIGSPIRFNGWVNFSILARKGKVTGKLNNGTRCKGSARVNILISHGGGKIRCRNWLPAKFKFILSSRFPIRGKGKGTLADGRGLLLNISPSK